MLKPLESVLIDMNDAFTENIGRRMSLSLGEGVWAVVVVGGCGCNNHRYSASE